jgi:hypothetical protein
MPNRVHVAKDYDNDIERFWWMSGKPELKNLPPNSRRACRGTITHDFDDLLGNPKAMHTAVIFNPVPGLPMGKNPRLSFRYWPAVRYSVSGFQHDSDLWKRLHTRPANENRRVLGSSISTRSTTLF